MGGGGIECHGKGSQRVKKICLYLDIVTIALTPPPVFLDTGEAPFFLPKKVQTNNCLKSIWIWFNPPSPWKMSKSKQKKVPHTFWIRAGPPPPLDNVQI